MRRYNDLDETRRDHGGDSWIATHDGVNSRPGDALAWRVGSKVEMGADDMSFARARALVIVGALVVCALIVAVVALVKDSEGDPSGIGGCPAGAVIADLQLHPEKELKINLFDGTGGTSSTLGVGNELGFRGFQVNRVDTRAKPIPAIKEPAIVRYGPKAVGGAQVVQAYFLDEATLDFQLNRDDASIDVVIGTGFKKLATTSEVKQALAQMGRPSEPPGTCVEK